MVGGITVCLPIAYGSIAWPLTKKPGDPDPCTHQWTLYVRSPYGHDLTRVLRRVTFTLHPSFKNSVREIVDHPFEVTERGWGEFEAVMDLAFHDPTERTIELRHLIKLFHAQTVPQAPAISKRPVVHEYYDEVVFTDPKPEFLRLLQELGMTQAPRHSLQEVFPLYSDLEDIKRIQSAHEFVKDQLRVAKDKLLRVESEYGVTTVPGL